MLLIDKGDPGGALAYAQRAPKIDEKIYGPNHPRIAIRANNISQILQDKADLNGALAYTQRALTIDEKIYGPDNLATKTIAANLEKIGLARQT